jgi:hypothetical protein
MYQLLKLTKHLRFPQRLYCVFGIVVKLNSDYFPVYRITEFFCDFVHRPVFYKLADDEQSPKTQ